MPSGQINAPWRPLFGTGAPGVNTARLSPYYDTSTNPFTAYIYRAGAWHKYGDSGPIDATSIQGVAVSAAAPNDGDTLIYSVGGNAYAPGAP